MADLPSGTVTFLYTDIEGSTRLWEEHPAAMREAMARHDTLLREAILSHEGRVFRTAGDGLCAAFATAPDALVAALGAQQALQSAPWGETGPLRVRMALHTGAAEVSAGDYVGARLNRVARLLAAGHGGQVLVTQATADLTRDALPPEASLRDLGEHRLRDLAQPERVYQLCHADLPSDFPPLQTLDTASHNLPLQLTSLVGREQEMAEVARLLQTTRLVTLTGTGGCGKTRLAQEVAREQVANYPDGVWFVDLAPLSDPALVPVAIASAVGIPEQSGQPLMGVLLQTMREFTLLLLLDNCEHLVEACARSADALLRGCPGIRILATSREPLGIGGEVSWRLPSLAVPASDWRPREDGRGLAALAQLGAVQLFVERAKAAEPSFALTSQNGPAVAQICRRLDGIPLAIELAAARVRVFAVERIAARLDDQFRLLSGGSRAALPRQQTLRALIDWSHDLLSEPERMLFRRLSVFAGGCTYEALEGVCGGDGLDEVDLPDVLARLVDRSLVDRSLVVAERRGGERYRPLEPLRQYGQEKLVEAAESEGLRDRHRDWYLQLAVEAEKHFYGPDQGAWYDRLEEDHDNLRAAIERCITQGNARDGLEFVWGLNIFWVWRGHLEEGHAFCERLLSLSAATVPTRGRAWALLRRGEFARDPPERWHGYQEAIETFRSVGEQHWATFFRLWLASLAAEQGDEQQAAEICRECLEIARQSHDRWIEGQALERLSRQARRLGNHAQALALMEQSLACYQAAGDVRAIGSAHAQMGLAFLDLGDLARARANLERGLAVARELKITGRLVEQLIVLAAVDRRGGDPASGQRRLDQAIHAAREARHLSAASLARVNLAFHAWVTGNPTAASRGLRQEATPAEVSGNDILARTTPDQVALGGLLLLGGGRTAEGVRLLGAAHRLGFRPALRFPDERERCEALVAEARRRLGDGEFAAAWTKGQEMSLEQAVACALEEDDA